MTARRWTLTIGLALLAVLVLATPAMAGRRWCSRDPIVALNGHDLQMWVAIPEEYETLVTGPVDVRIGVPAGVTTETLFTDEGFNGFGETVTYDILKGGKVYTDGSFDIEVRVMVPIDTKKAKSIPLQLTTNVGGDAIETAPGVWTYEGGKTYIVEVNNAGIKLATRFPGASQNQQ
jgi:hypothetical protein